MHLAQPHLSLTRITAEPIAKEERRARLSPFQPLQNPALPVARGQSRAFWPSLRA
jgi:hypothetical protein